MRIALFTDAFLPMTNGVVTALLTLAKGMADRGHKITIIAPELGQEKEFSHKNIKVIRIKGIPALFYNQFKLTSPINWSVYRILLKDKVQIIHIETPITLGLEGIMLGKILRIPIVGTFHTFIADPQYLAHVRLGGELTQRVAWGFSNFYFNQCTLVTSPSQSTREELLAHKCRRPIKVISNGIDFSQFDNTHAPAVRAHYSRGGRLCLFVGRIAHEKNILYLLDCFAVALKKAPKTVLLLVGDGPQMPEVKQRIKRNGMQRNVHVLGKVDHDKLVKSGIFGACDLFLTASVTENQPMTVLEAQANGQVCVVINKRGMKDLVEDGVNGFAVKDKDKKAYADAIVKLCSDDALLASMRARTLESIQKHDVKQVIDTWERTYAALDKEGFLEIEGPPAQLPPAHSTHPQRRVVLTSSDAKFGDFLIRHWLRSLKANVNLRHTDIVVLDYGLAERQKNALLKEHVRVIPCIRDSHVMMARLRDAAAFLEKSNYDQVLACDGGDILFQGDLDGAFRTAPDTIRACFEVHTLARYYEDHLERRFKKPYAQRIKRLLKGKKIINAGVIFAPVDRYVHMCKTVYGMFLDTQRAGADQVGINYYLHSTGFTPLPETYNFVLWTSGQEMMVKKGVFYTAHGERIKVVHNSGAIDMLRPIKDFGYGPEYNRINRLKLGTVRTLSKIKHAVKRRT